jgi:hypothetical protein
LPHVAAGAAGVDHLAPRRHARRIAPHGARRAGDLVDLLALHLQRDQNAPICAGVGAAGHDLAHHRLHVGFGEIVGDVSVAMAVLMSMSSPYPCPCLRARAR